MGILRYVIPTGAVVLYPLTEIIKAIMFNIHQVGDDGAAEDFIKDLELECRDILFCNPRPLDEIVSDADPKERNKLVSYELKSNIII